MMPKIDGMSEEMPGGVCCVSIEYGCETCRNATEQYHTCEVNAMLPIMLVMSGRSVCPFRNMKREQIEKELNQIEQ